MPATVNCKKFLNGILLAIASSGVIVPSVSAAFEVEMGAVTVQSTFTAPAWTRVSFILPFSTTPVVVALPTNEGGDTSTLRIRNVTTTGFEVLQVEPNANDGRHVAMNTAYFAAEPGSHILPDGSRMIVVQHTTASFVSRLISNTWDTVFFANAFNTTPAILAQVQTIANESQNPPVTSSAPFMDVAIRNVGTTSFQVSLDRVESITGTVSNNEQIGIIAFESGTDFSFTDALGTPVILKGVGTAQNIRGWDNGCFTNSFPSAFVATPLAVASANTRAGADGGWVRRCSITSSTLGLTIDEDIDNDAERGHTTEAAGIIAASTAFHANFAVDLTISKNVDVQTDPYNGATNPKSIPEADVAYTIEVTNDGSGIADSDSVVITDDVPAELRLCVSTACLAGGPVIFDDSGSPVPPGVSLGPIAYSNNGGSSFTYTPTPDADGFDSAVNAIQITLGGALVGVAPAGSPSFQLQLAARVN